MIITKRGCRSQSRHFIACKYGFGASLVPRAIKTAARAGPDPGRFTYPMIACTDVHYHSRGAVVGCVLFREWHDHQVAGEMVEHLSHVAPYEPGMFYRRELPCLMEVLKRVEESLAAVIIDGYVWLGQGKAPGLGAHLYQALREEIPVIGVAKSRFARSAPTLEVFRGRSRRPLYVSSAGIDPREAAEKVGTMHGAFRIPTLLKRVDRLCRAG